MVGTSAKWSSSSAKLAAQFDGVSASGDATLRLIHGGDVTPSTST